MRQNLNQSSGLGLLDGMPIVMQPPNAYDAEATFESESDSEDRGRNKQKNRNATIGAHSKTSSK